MAPLRETLITLACTVLSWAFRPLRRRLPLPHNPSLLVLKPCCLGDLLLATPTLAALRRRLPGARIVLATSAWSRPAVEGNPCLDELLDSGRIGQGAGPGEYWAFVQALRRRRFDAAVVLDRSPLVAALPLVAGIPIRAGLDSGGRGFSLTHPVPTSGDRHEALRYQDVAVALGCAPELPPLQFVPAASDGAWARAVLPEDKAWVAIHPGGGVNPGSTLLGKRWPMERFAAVAERLLAARYAVVVVGAPQDGPLAQAILFKVRAPDRSGLLDLTGRTTFGQLGAALAQCRLFLGNDTGPMHLAVAVGTPVVAIFGPSKPAFYGPMSTAASVLRHGEECSACHFQGGLAARCMRDYACMRAVTVDEVWNAVQGRLGATDGPASAGASLPTPAGDATI
ncbi:MAG: lipopolysaccharide heptosyltransferase II [Chloroflexi bacterium]|nr:lipopolysaccharide heptosyltransferase II [Chloroflexota bacterium]